MNLSEATKRLQENRGDQTALREYYNRFDNFITYLVKDAAHLYPEFDAENTEQELRQTLLEVIDKYSSSYTESQWENYIFQSLRNRLHDIVSHFYVEKKHVPVRIEEMAPEEEREHDTERIQEQLVSLEQDVYDILQSSEAEAIVDKIQNELAAESSEEARLGLSVLNLILEAAPEELTLRALTEALRSAEPESKWHMNKVHDVLNYLRYKLESAGFSEDWAVA